jgi:hypothetical protein
LPNEADEETTMLLDVSRFTKPNIQFFELNMAIAAQMQIQPDQFRHRGRRLVKRIVLSCYDMPYAVPANANTSFLQAITGRYWRRMKEEANGVVVPLTSFDNAQWRRQVPRALGDGPVQYEFGWIFDHPFIVPDNDTMFLDVCTRAMQAGSNAIGAGGLRVAVHGYGATTGKPRMLENPAVWPTNVANVQLRYAATAPTTQNAVNQFGEDFVAERLVVYSNGTLAGVADTRIFNHIGLRVYFEPKCHFSLCAPDVDNWVPVNAYGQHLNLDGYVSIWEPQGDPYIVEDSEAMGWEFVNGAGRAERVQVSLVTLLEEPNVVVPCQ